MNKLASRDIYNDSPPSARSRGDNNPTLLFSWWCTALALTIILFRLGGRLSRAGKLFREDIMMALAIVPLAIRMGLVHVILKFGTNNQVALELTDDEIWERSVGSRLVLASRIFYSAFIWTAKLAIWEFLRRLTRTYWKQNYSLALRLIRICLGLTFCAVVLSTVTECYPIVDYWRVIPVPRPACRQGYAHLITMGAADILTDVLLIVFPVPIVMYSSMSLKRKISLLLLFSLSITLVAITGTRVPLVIQQRGSQQYRTLWASCEILAAAAVSNSLVLGSFIRDKGIKKRKYRSETFTSTTTVSTWNSIDRQSYKKASVAQKNMDSDDDLIQSSGYRLDSDIELKELKIAVRSHRRHDPNTTLIGYEREAEDGDDGRDASAAELQRPKHLNDTFDMRAGSSNESKTVRACAHTQDSCRKHASLQSQSSAFYDLSNAAEMGRKCSHCSFPLDASASCRGEAAFQTQERFDRRERSISFVTDKGQSNSATKQYTNSAKRQSSSSRKSSRPEHKQRDSGRGFMELDFAVVEDHAEDIADGRHRSTDCTSLSGVSPKSSVCHFSARPVASQRELQSQAPAPAPAPSQATEPLWSDWSFEQGSQRARRADGSGTSVPV